jgi:hypothetical protein
MRAASAGGGNHGKSSGSGANLDQEALVQMITDRVLEALKK